jgi:hypothetical protein
VLAFATPASAQDPLEAYEIATLGPEHAAEHAAARAEAAAMPVHARRAHAAALPDAPADRVGRWSSDTVDLPTWAINAVLMPTGKVALWGRAPTKAPDSFLRDNLSEFWVWDPVSGSLSRHDAPRVDLNGDGVLDAPAPLFCSGQSLLADGQVFIAGGTLGIPDWMGGTTPDWRGLDHAYTFDPWSLTWREQPKPRRGRWYPSQVQLADGRIAILAGLDETGTGGAKNLELEVFTPPRERGGIGTMTHHPAGDRDTAFYPHLFTLPSGKVLLAGPGQNDSALLDPAALDGLVTGSAWTDLPGTSTLRIGGNAVLWPQGAEHDARVTLLGGFHLAPQGGDAVRDTETLDADAPASGWTLNGDGIPAMNVARSYGNVVQLPNGALVAIGGGAGSAYNEGDANWTAGNQELKRVELLRPGVDDHWTLGPAQQKWRAYHSTALLLPDGRVLSAGDDYWALGDVRRQSAGVPMDVGEIYSPPYLFDGDQLAPRPRIDDAPAAVPYRAPFGVKVSQRDAARAVLVAPGATTHGADMNQRLVVLETVRSRDGVGLDVRAPAGPAAAPPGYYMLFVLDQNRVPSVAKIVHVG